MTIVIVWAKCVCLGVVVGIDKVVVVVERECWWQVGVVLMDAVVWQLWEW